MNDQQKYEWLRILACAGSPEDAARMGGVSLQEAAGVWERYRKEAPRLPRQDTQTEAPVETVGENQNGIFGIDISQYQGTPDFQKVKDAGVNFVIARAGFGRNNMDRRFARNAAECNRLGIPFGAYWFSYALTVEDAKKEALYCLAAVKRYRLEYPVFYDLEYASVDYAAKQGVVIDKKLATQMALAFCSEIGKARYYASNYCNSDYAKNMFGQEAFDRFDFWYASYRGTCDRKNAGLWQYSDKGKISGIERNADVDLDRSFKNYPVIIKNAGLNGF